MMKGRIMTSKSFDTMKHAKFYLEWQGFEPTRKFDNELSRYKKGKQVAKLFIAPALKTKNVTITFN